MPPEPLDPIIHQAVRLRVMALLSRNRTAPFVWVRDTLGLTDGNLGSHMARLAEAGYASSTRVLTRSGFQVWLRITPAGDDAYQSYLSSLRSYLEPSEAGRIVSSSAGADPLDPPRKTSRN
jgi:DNA-binding MarR family transcriptional regulator